MILDSPERTLDISFRVNHEGKTYIVYATTGSIKCFECGDVGHKRHACPHKERETEGNVSRAETDIFPAFMPTLGVRDEIEDPPGAILGFLFNWVAQGDQEPARGPIGKIM